MWREAELPLDFRKEWEGSNRIVIGMEGYDQVKASQDRRSGHLSEERYVRA